MRKVALAILCSLMLVPSLVLAQANCPSCILGLWDEQGLVNNVGAMTAGTPKDLYLGLKTTGSTETGLTGVEFSIAGIRQDTDGILVLGVTPIPAATAIGSPQAPADTTMGSTGTGGMNIAWSECLTIPGGSLAVARIQLLSFSAVTDKVFRVKRKYPTSNNVNYPNNAVMVRCDGPTFTTVKVGEGCYVAGYSGTPPVGCPVIAVEEQTWSGVKQLYN